jgi:aromatic ring-opening dioxygenase catalytic subunit (LigB family)
MAKLVGSFAASHAPNIARSWDTLKNETRDWLTTRYDELGKRVKALEPDVLVIHSNDHWINFFLENMPAFLIGVGEEHDGPPEPFMQPIFKGRTFPGHAGLGSHLLEFAMEADFDPAYSHRIKVDHGIGIPLWRMGFDTLPPIVPVFLNLMEEPFPTPKRCLAWGHMIREAIEAYPEDLRVVVLGTGGLSHSIGETTMGWIDEPFDHACMELFKSASDEKIAFELARMLKETGNGGAEVRSWSVAHGAAGGKGFEMIDYIPMPETLIGCGLAEWKFAA